MCFSGNGALFSDKFTLCVLFVLVLTEIMIVVVAIVLSFIVFGKVKESREFLGSPPLV